ncbi:MAG: hypothetical protein ABSF03_20720 [Streptosporangiaceae bacterium]
MSPARTWRAPSAGPSLRNVSAKVARAKADPWATAEPGGFSDEPPF